APLPRASRGVEDAEDLHHAGARVLDAVHRVGRKVEARAGTERRLAALDVRDALALEDVADLVVRMAVVRRARRLDDPDELCHVLREEDAEGPVLVGALLVALVEPDRDGLA